jgi:hypothetical protein
MRFSWANHFSKKTKLSVWYFKSSQASQQPSNFDVLHVGKLPKPEPQKICQSS